MPLLVHAVPRPFRVHGQTVQHARLADGKVGDIDHLLHFAIAFRFDLAGLERDQTAQCIFVRAQFRTDETDRLAALGCRQCTPLRKYGA